VFHEEVETHDVNESEDLIFVLDRKHQGGQETQTIGLKCFLKIL